MTRREFTHRIAGGIVWAGLLLEGCYFFYLASRIAAAARGAPGWRPDMPEPVLALAGTGLGLILLLLGVFYVLRLFNTRGWIHILAPVFLIGGLFLLAMAGAITERIYGDWQTLPSALNGGAGFGLMAIGVFSVVARLFMPAKKAVEALPPDAPADRPEP